jgi:hypothetical protein
MEIIYAAEPDSIASLISDYTRCPVSPAELEVAEDPGETGSFYIDWNFNHYTLKPDGTICQRAKIE